MAKRQRHTPEQIISKLRETEVKTETLAKITAGDAKMFYVDTTGWLVAADYTEGLHPNIVGHQKATVQLTAELKKHLN